MLVEKPSRPRRGFGPRLALLFALVAALPYFAAHTLTGGTVSDIGREIMTLLGAAVGGWLVGVAVERGLAARHRGYRRAIRRLASGDFEGVKQDANDHDGDGLSIEIERAAIRLLQLWEDLDDQRDDREFEVSRLRAEMGRLGSENMKLQSDILQYGKSWESLRDFVVAISKLSDQAQIAGQLLTYVDNEVDYDVATVMLVDPESRQLAPVALSNREKGTRLVGKYIKDIQSLQPLGARSAIGRVVEAGKTLLIDDVDADRRGLVTRESIMAEIAIPLKVQDKVIGVLHLESHRAGAYGEYEALLTLMSNATATAIGNIRLFEEEAKVRLLREMDKVKSQLISTVSHELRTPLSAIKGYSTSLQRPEAKLDERTRLEFLTIIEEEADRLSEMIENLLDLSKIEAGVLRLHKQPTQLERIVRKVVEQQKRRAPDYRFRVHFPAVCPSVPVAPHRIEQVIRNLVENAVKYSPEGGRVMISGEVEGDWFVVGVSDEGMGIPAEHLGRIFEPFYQVDSGTTRRVGGSGLGLAICRGFVSAHGGEVSVESMPGKGSTFRFSLPLSAEYHAGVAVQAGALEARD